MNAVAGQPVLDDKSKSEALKWGLAGSAASAPPLDVFDPRKWVATKMNYEVYTREHYEKHQDWGTDLYTPR